MTVIKVPLLYCDAPPCHLSSAPLAAEPYRTDTYPQDTAATQREDARRDGWHHQAGNDICEACWTEGFRGSRDGVRQREEATA